jgi:carboxylesterase type B
MCVEYVCHASELPVVFHFTANWTFTPPEAAMSDGVVQAWTHFADVGTPATVPEPAGWPVWRPHDGGAETSFVLHLDVPVWFEDSFDERCTMWDKIGYVW